MSVSCDKNDLVNASCGYCYGNQKQVDSIIIYLLTQIAGDTSTPSELATKACGFQYPDTRSRDAVMLYLLCSIADAAGA